MLLRLTITDGTGQARFSSPCSVAASLDPPPPLAGSRVYRGLVLTSSTFPSVQSLKTPDVGLEPPTPELVFHKVMSGGSRQPTVPNQHYSLKSTSGTELYTFDMGIESGMLRSIQCGDAADFAVISTASACVVAAPCVAVTPAVFFAVSPLPPPAVAATGSASGFVAASFVAASFSDQRLNSSARSASARR